MTAASTETRSSGIEREFTERTPGSSRFLEGASGWLPGGMSRYTGWHLPYPLVFARGEGPHLYDIDGNRYVDVYNNGMSLIHGHAFPPVVRAVSDTLRRGWAWPGPSDLQAEFAELLVSRVKPEWQAYFTNSGTEAAMLAVKLARACTGKPAILKAAHAYHGTYDDLEVGLYGRPEVPGKVLLAEFGDLDAFRRTIETHRAELAAVILEPVMCTGSVRTAPDGFLSGVQDACRSAGVMFVLDDCLMLRLAVGGSIEKFGLEPDLVGLGKFVGGGLPMGAVLGRRELLARLDPASPHGLRQGGSFNGNLLSCAAGIAAMTALDAASISAMDEAATQLKHRLADAAEQLGVAINLDGIGSVFGIQLNQRDSEERRHAPSEHDRLFRLACLNRGVYLPADVRVVMSTVLSTDEVALVGDVLCSALADVTSLAA